MYVPYKYHMQYLLKMVAFVHVIFAGCSTEDYLVSQGSVTMSSAHRSDGILDQYQLDSSKSWSAITQSSSEYIQVNTLMKPPHVCNKVAWTCLL